MIEWGEYFSNLLNDNQGVISAISVIVMVVIALLGWRFKDKFTKINNAINGINLNSFNMNKNIIEINKSIAEISNKNTQKSNINPKISVKGGISADEVLKILNNSKENHNEIIKKIDELQQTFNSTRETKND